MFGCPPFTTSEINGPIIYTVFLYSGNVYLDVCFILTVTEYLAGSVFRKYEFYWAGHETERIRRGR